MRRVQIILDDDLVEAVDEIVKKLKTNRSAFTREALRNAISRHKIHCLKEQHRKGYQKHPVQQGEFYV
jgi:metal-responsive CopG/Arc/MetJ family transcriptional regulator